MRLTVLPIRSFGSNLALVASFNQSSNGALPAHAFSIYEMCVSVRAAETTEHIKKQGVREN